MDCSEVDKSVNKIQRLPPEAELACTRCGAVNRWLVAGSKAIPDDPAHAVYHLRCAACGRHATQIRLKNTSQRKVFRKRRVAFEYEE